MHRWHRIDVGEGVGLIFFIGRHRLDCSGDDFAEETVHGVRITQSQRVSCLAEAPYSAASVKISRTSLISMHSSSRFAFRFLAALTIALAAFSAMGQFSNPSAAPGTPVHNARALRPPAGARVAIFEFEDLECPDCARANPLLKEASDSPARN